MGIMKAISEAIADAQEAGLIPTELPRHVFLLMDGTEPVGVYMHEDLAKYDCWMCNASAEREYKVIPVAFFTETLEEVQCHE